MSTQPLRVVIAGGGVAALEAALALHDLAGDRVELSLIAPGPDFVYRPMAVREPFGTGGAHHYPLAAIVQRAGATLVADELASVDPQAHSVTTTGGRSLDYDVLVLCLGARMHPAYPHATTIDDRRLDEQLHGLVQDVEGGYVKSLAFVAPTRMAWPLPLYELALQMAARAYDMNIDVAISLVTPEDAPLAIFGPNVSAAVTTLLQEAGISLATAAYASVPEQGTVTMVPGTHRLQADRIVALPELSGPAVRGLTPGEHGFIPIDAACRVRDVEDVYAAGDAADFPVKHGGLAALQADTIARAIAQRAGAEVTADRFVPEVQGVLITGRRPLYLSARITGGRGFDSVVSDEPPPQPVTKITARHLQPVLDELEGHATGVGAQG